MNLYPSLQAYIQTALVQPITEERKTVLQKLVDYIQAKVDAEKAIRLNFICTHNSRRSQFSQIWAQLASEYFGIRTDCFSGGVEVTAFNERAVAAMERAGFVVQKAGTVNPKYFLFYNEEDGPILAFSKLFNDPEIAPKHFAAVMTCADADENCPFIPQAEARIPVRYEDPKAFDGTEKEAEMYDTRSLQIASEMFYVFSKIIK